MKRGKTDHKMETNQITIAKLHNHGLEAFTGRRRSSRGTCNKEQGTLNEEL